MAAAIDDLAGGAQSGADRRLTVFSESETVAEIAPAGDNAADQGALGVGFNQGADEVDLIQRHQFENFVAHFTLRGSRQSIDHLQALWGHRAKKFVEIAFLGAAFDERIETGPGAAVGEGDDGHVADLRMRLKTRDNRRRVLGETNAAAFPVGEIEAARDGVIELLPGRHPQPCDAGFCAPGCGVP